MKSLLLALALLLSHAPPGRAQTDAGEQNEAALDALVETAAKSRITSEHGNPNFNTDAFMKLGAADEARARSAASRLEDRLQRIAALAALYRGRAESLSKRSDDARASSETST